MPKKNLTIEEVKKAKIELEQAVLEMVQDFEKTCGVKISYINIDRKRDERETVPEPAVERTGPVVNVTASMELDLIY